MEVCAVKALGGSWRQKSSHSNDSQHRRTGGGTGKSKKGGPKLTCAKPGCKSHLSKGIQKRAEQWAEDTGKDVSKHLCLCYKHYKETVAADMAGVDDAMTVTLTGGRSVTYSRKKDEYHASFTTLYSLHSPKLALRGVTSDLVTDMCMYCHGIIGVSPHDYGRAMLWQICPTHAVSVTYRLGVTAAG
eukprot:SAG25_NODE_271_length_10616_cov_28.967091_11_plen_187_part_00